MQELPEMMKEAAAAGIDLLAISLDDDGREYKRAMQKLGPKGATTQFLWLQEGARAAWFRSNKLDPPAQLPAHLAVDSTGQQRCLRRGAVDGPELADFRAYVSALR